MPGSKNFGKLLQESPQAEIQKANRDEMILQGHPQQETILQVSREHGLPLWLNNTVIKIL